jgi:hypothetical protein
LALFSQESETLVSQNANLKSEIQKLRQEKNRLMDILSRHQTGCSKRPRPDLNADDGLDELLQVSTF